MVRVVTHSSCNGTPKDRQAWSQDDLQESRSRFKALDKQHHELTQRRCYGKSFMIMRVAAVGQTGIHDHDEVSVSPVDTGPRGQPGALPLGAAHGGNSSATA